MARIAIKEELNNLGLYIPPYVSDDDIKVNDDMTEAEYSFVDGSGGKRTYRYKRYSKKSWGGGEKFPEGTKFKNENGIIGPGGPGFMSSRKLSSRRIAIKDLRQFRKPFHIREFDVSFPSPDAASGYAHLLQDSGVEDMVVDRKGTNVSVRIADEPGSDDYTMAIHEAGALGGVITEHSPKRKSKEKASRAMSQRATSEDWKNAQKIPMSKLLEGDKIIYDSGLIREVRSVYSARQRGYLVIEFRDGTRGGGHGSQVLNVIRAQGKGRSRKAAIPLFPALTVGGLGYLGYQNRKNKKRIEDLETQEELRQQHAQWSQSQTRQATIGQDYDGELVITAKFQTPRQRSEFIDDFTEEIDGHVVPKEDRLTVKIYLSTHANSNAARPDPRKVKWLIEVHDGKVIPSQGRGASRRRKANRRASSGQGNDDELVIVAKFRTPRQAETFIDTFEEEGIDGLAVLQTDRKIVKIHLSTYEDEYNAKPSPRQVRWLVEVHDGKVIPTQGRSKDVTGRARGANLYRGLYGFVKSTLPWQIGRTLLTGEVPYSKIGKEASLRASHVNASVRRIKRRASMIRANRRRSHGRQIATIIDDVELEHPETGEITYVVYEVTGTLADQGQETEIWDWDITDILEPSDLDERSKDHLIDLLYNKLDDMDVMHKLNEELNSELD